jgi:hypothetical protein
MTDFVIATEDALSEALAETLLNYRTLSKVCSTWFENPSDAASSRRSFPPVASLFRLASATTMY